MQRCPALLLGICCLANSSKCAISPPDSALRWEKPLTFTVAQLGSKKHRVRLGGSEEPVRSMWYRKHPHHHCQQFEATERAGPSTNIARWVLPLMTFEVEFAQLLWVRRGESTTEPDETGTCFVKTLSLPFLSHPHSALYGFSALGLFSQQALFIKTTKFSNSWVSGCLTRPCTGVSSSALVIFYFSLGFFCLPVWEPN